MARPSRSSSPTATAELAVLEQRYRRGEIDGSVIADTTAGWLDGRTVAETWDVLHSAPWIDGLAETAVAGGVMGGRVVCVSRSEAT